MYMTCKHYLGRVLGWEGSKLGFLGKRGLKPKNFLLNWWVFAWASGKRACPVDSGHSSLERAPSEQPSWFWIEFTWASPKRAPSEWAQNATGSWSLKRATLRLSEQHPVQQILIFRFVHLGTNPNFLNCFFGLDWSLLMYLILLEHHLNQIGTSLWNRFKCLENVQEPQFLT